MHKVFATHRNSKTFWRLGGIGKAGLGLGDLSELGGLGNAWTGWTWLHLGARTGLGKAEVT